MAKSGRKYLDWRYFDTPEMAIDLLENAVRDSVDFDAHGDQKVWRAMVLSPARRISNTEGAGIGVVNKEGISVSSPMYKFKARLLGENSPHMLIPDPCDLAINSDPRYVEAIIEMHIDVIFVKTGMVDPPTNGDIILVELKKNDMSYDLQKATFLRSVARNVSAEPFMSTKGCSLTFEMFDDLDLFVDTPLPTGGGYVDIIPVSKQIVISQAGANFITMLREKISQDAIRLIYVTSGVRTPEAQARAIAKKRELHKCDSAIAGKPAPGSPCWPIYKLYAQKELILQALRVPNSIPEMQKVFARQVGQQKFLSRHMRGRGLDLRVSNLNPEQIQIIKTAVEELNGNYQYENDPPHIHIGIPSQIKNNSVSSTGTETEDAAGHDSDVS